MAFVPGEGTNVPDIDSVNGSGIQVSTLGDVDYLATALVAGTNVTLIPSISNKTITINASPGGGGITSVGSGIGSGIVANTVAGHVTLTGAYVAGTGITMTPNPTNENIEISNNQSVASVNGSGITITPSGSVSNVAANLLGGTGIGITSSGLNTSKTISNTGVTSLAAGSGISLSGATGAVTITNANSVASVNGSGITVTPAGAVTNVATNLTSGTGISITPSGVNTSQQIANTGVTSVTGGTGITVSSSTGATTLTNTGVTSVTAGTGISASSSTGATTLTNTGVTSLVAGSGITLSGSTGAVTVTATAAAPPSWHQVWNSGQTFNATNQFFIFWSSSTPGWIPWPTNNPAQVIVQMQFSNITYAGAFGDPTIFVYGGNLPSAGWSIQIGQDVLYNFQSSPQSLGTLDMFSYSFIIPAGNAGANISINATCSSFSCTVASQIFINY